MTPIESVLTALEQARVRYLLVGGVAVVLHGYLRTTADLDLILEVDVFVEEPLDFAAAHARAVRADLGACEASVVGLDDLLALKRRAGRPRDLEDIEALERLSGRDDP